MPTNKNKALNLDRVLNAPHLPVLDGLRALAVTIVIAGHFGLRLGSGLGVTIFFVLSGFLITWLLIKECDSRGSVSLSAFYTRRTRRIFPAYYAAAALLLLVDNAGGQYRYTFGFTVEGLLIGFVITQLLVLHAEAPWKLFDARPVRYLGRVSYGMYLYHQWGLSIGHHVVAQREWLEVPAGLTATVFLATASYVVIERPFLRSRREAPVSCTDVLSRTARGVRGVWNSSSRRVRCLADAVDAASRRAQQWCDVRTT